MASLMAGLAAVVLISLAMVAPISADYGESTGTIYNLTIGVDGESYTISVDANIIYYNRESIPLSEIRMTLYPNAYRTPETVPLISSLEYAYPAGFNEGGITITSASLRYEIRDTMTLALTLEHPLQPGEYTQFSMSYVIQVPETQNRMGHYDGILSLGNALPYVGVMDEGEWILYPYLSRGDPFYSESADWNVTITVDEGWALGSTGNIISIEHDGPTSTYHIKAARSRDFALACSREYGLYEQSVDSTVVRSLFRLGQEERGIEAARIAIRAFTLFERILGEYPYGTLTLAMTNLGGAAGMEYPQMIFVDAPYYDKELQEYFETTIVHEIAHQWWYGIVGNDQVADPFLDESLAQFMTLLYYEEYPSSGQDTFKSYLYNTYEVGKERISDDIVAQPLMSYPTNYEYVLMVYYKGPLVLDMMRWAVGPENFLVFLSDLYESNMFGTLTTQGFIDAFNEFGFTTRPESALTDAIVTPSLPDVAAGDSTWDGTMLSIHPVNPLGLPCGVAVRYGNGSIEQLVPPYTIEIRDGRIPVSYLLDPENNLLESDETNNEGIISAPDVKQRNGTEVVGVILILVLCAIIAAAIREKRR